MMDIPPANTEESGLLMSTPGWRSKSYMMSFFLLAVIFVALSYHQSKVAILLVIFFPISYQIIQSGNPKKKWQPSTWRSKSSMMSSWCPLAAYIRPGHHGDDADDGEEEGDNADDADNGAADYGDYSDDGEEEDDGGERH